jgi:hypothetical protein
MATIGNVALTLSEWAKRLDPDGKIATIVELLNQTNECLDDMMWVEGNLPTGHRTTVRGGLPKLTWRLLNYGVPISKSVTAQVTDTCGMLEGYSEVDKSLADLNGNTSEFRMSEDKPFLESMNQTVASSFFYGNSDTDPERIMGLAPRYNDITAENAENILDGGGTGTDNTSMWFVTWGANTAHMIFPKGSTMGLQHNDKGQVTLQDPQGNNYEGYRTHYKWDLGFCLRDWRYCVRIANIDVSDLPSFGDETADNSAPLMRLMIRAYNKIPNMGMGRTVIYANRTVKTWLEIMAEEKSNVNLTIDMYAGKPITRFWGIPIRMNDALLNTEDQVA